MRRKRMHGKKRSPFRKDPSLEDYSKNPNVPRFGEWDRGTITKTPSKIEKLKAARKRNMILLQDLTMPGVSKIKGLVQATKDKLKK